MDILVSNSLFVINSLIMYHLYKSLFPYENNILRMLWDIIHGKHLEQWLSCIKYSISVSSTDRFLVGKLLGERV